MVALRFVPPRFATLGAAAAFLRRVLADAPRSTPAKVLHEEDLSDWLKRDVGLLDGRDTAARRRSSERPASRP